MKQAKLAHVLSHPQRVRLLELLAEQEASPPMLREQIGPEISLGAVSYHVGVLREYGCLELVRTVPRNGANEYFFRVKPDLLADPLYVELRPGAPS
jgi:DNA-binding transcriptional ArsR family regulator